MSMSTQLSECRHCKESYEHGYNGEYCSDDCVAASRGEKALNQVRQDHRLCGTCGNFLKQVEPPNDEWVNESKSRTQFALHNGGIRHNKHGQHVFDITNCPDEQRTQTESVIGFQYRTPEATTVIKEREGPTKYDRIKTTATGCSCGCTETTDTEEILRESDPVRILTNYVRTFLFLYAEGTLDTKLDKDRFFEAYKETRDFELAVGRGLK